MKYAAAILAFFCLSALSSQTGPPTLRCLEVLPNGNVILHWSPAADPGNQFLHYEIWFGINKQQPFSFSGQTVAPVSTPSVVHSISSGSAQTLYYFIRTARTDGTFSGNSDTVQTIFLNISSAQPALRLVYNSPGGGTVPTFTIEKEWPIGSINTLTVTKEKEYHDVITVCDDLMNYQVSLRHNSGCVSRSNTIFGRYSNSKDPDTTYVDSISVLPDGRTVLAWTIVTDTDVDSYMVIKRELASNVYIDRLAGRTTVSYTYSSTEAADKPVRLFVMAQDSCGRRGTFDERPVTMHVDAFYDHCNYRTHLLWNAYHGMKKGIKEYRVYYSVDGAPFVLLGATEDSAYIHEKVDPEKQLCYFVRVVNRDESITASSNRACFFSTQVGIPRLFYMSTATVNDAAGVDLRIYVDQDAGFASMDIQRSEDTINGFITVGTLPGNGTALYSFTDVTARTGEKAYWYRAVLLDSCGNARSRSNLCRTILLNVTMDNNKLFESQLTWSHYEGFAGGLNRYAVYRILSTGGSPQLVSYVPANVTSYTDNLESAAGDGASIAYFILAIEAEGSPVGITDESRSNTRDVYLEGRVYVPNAFAPAGENKTWKPVTHFVQKSEYLVRVFNRWGQEIFSARDDQSAWDGGNCDQGVYVYLVSYVNSRGEYREQKGTVMLIR